VHTLPLRFVAAFAFDVTCVLRITSIVAIDAVVFCDHYVHLRCVVPLMHLMLLFAFYVAFVDRCIVIFVTYVAARCGRFALIVALPLPFASFVALRVIHVLRFTLCVAVALQSVYVSLPLIVDRFVATHARCVARFTFTVTFVLPTLRCLFAVRTLRFA